MAKPVEGLSKYGLAGKGFDDFKRCPSCLNGKRKLHCKWCDGLGFISRKEGKHGKNSKGKQGAGMR